MRVFHLGLRFGLEICALAAVAYGGWHAAGPVWLRILLAVALPLLAAVVWGRWVAPKASRPLPDPQRLVPEWAVFGGATVALALTGHPILAAALAVLAALNRVALRQSSTAPRVRSRPDDGGRNPGGAWRRRSRWPRAGSNSRRGGRAPD